MGQLPRPPLHFLEQPRVLDGDYRLVGKGLEQIDLSVGEGTNLHASNKKCADGRTCADQRDGQYRAEPKAPGMVANLWILSSFGLQVGGMNDLAIESSTSS